MRSMTQNNRLFTGSRLIVATHNAGKAREFAAMLGPYVPEVVSAAALGLPEPEETGTSFAENALIKARAVALATHEIALADDSGLCVGALDEAPGIFSARWAGPDKDMRVAMQRVHDELGYKPDRSAFFVCVLALVWPDGHVEYGEGRVNGAITWPPRGTGGFGYSPIFVASGDTRTFAEITDDERNARSHRGQALRALIGKCFRQ
jgi:XTP/dITP diphosphohydrolase